MLPQRNHTKLFWAILLTTSGIVVGIVSLLDTEIWDGKFSQAEFHIVFLNPENEPIGDVGMSVIDQQGEKVYGYPIVEYRKGVRLRSDKTGTLVFHHISVGVEFAGECKKLFWVVPIKEDQPPAYRCFFFKDGYEVKSLDFHELYDKPSIWMGYNEVETDSSQWIWVGGISPTLPEHLDPAKMALPDRLLFPICKRTVVLRPEKKRGHCVP